MGQSSIICFITPEELSEVLSISIEKLQPVFVSEEWNDLKILSNPIEIALKDSKLGRFYLGLEVPSPEMLKSAINLWEAGFIQIDNPNRSESYLGETLVAFRTGLPDSKAYRMNEFMYRTIVREIKRRSTRGKYLICTRGNKLDTRTWLSNGAYQWMRNGKQVTTSSYLDRTVTEPVVIHKLIET